MSSNKKNSAEYNDKKIREFLKALDEFKKNGFNLGTILGIKINSNGEIEEDKKNRIDKVFETCFKDVMKSAHMGSTLTWCKTMKKELSDRQKKLFKNHRKNLITNNSEKFSKDLDLIKKVATSGINTAIMAAQKKAVGKKVFEFDDYTEATEINVHFTENLDGRLSDERVRNKIKELFIPHNENHFNNDPIYKRLEQIASEKK